VPEMFGDMNKWRMAFLEYGRHGANCPMPSAPCDCGFSELVEEAGGGVVTTPETELWAVKAECERLRRRCIALATEKIELETELAAKIIRVGTD